MHESMCGCIGGRHLLIVNFHKCITEKKWLIQRLCGLPPMPDWHEALAEFMKVDFFSYQLEGRNYDKTNP